MASATETVTYDQLFSLTERTRTDRVTDNIGNSTPNLDIFHAAGQVEVASGGESIEERLLYAYQDIEWMSDREKVSTEDKEGITKAIYPWRYCLSPVNISLTDELRARASETKAMDFAESKIIQSRQGLRTGINTTMAGAQSGKSMLGFQDTIRDSVSTGTLGGIDLSAAANSWFRNNAYTTAVTWTTQTVANLYNGWVQLGVQFEAASDVNDEVTHIGTGATIYGEMLSTLESAGYTRFVNATSYSLGAKGGQKTGQGPMFRGAQIYKDRSFAASHVYLYNVKALKLKILEGANFSKTRFVQADANGILAKIAFYVVGIQFVAVNPRRTSVMTTVT